MVTKAILGKHTKFYCADRGTLSHVQFSEDKMTLFLSGHILDTVKCMEEFIPHIRNNDMLAWINRARGIESNARYLLRCRALALKSPDLYFTKEPLSDAIWRTFV